MISVDPPFVILVNSACVALIFLCGFINSRVVSEINRQVDLPKAFAQSPERMASTLQRMRNVFSLHQKLFPASPLRKISVALLGTTLCALIAVLTISFSALSQASRSYNSSLTISRR
jgi:hypothetical protein